MMQKTAALEQRSRTGNLWQRMYNGGGKDPLDIFRSGYFFICFLFSFSHSFDNYAAIPSPAR